MRKTVSLIAIAAALALAAAPAGAQQKTIRDVGEYNAYMAALNNPDPVARAYGMEAFRAKYPASIMKIDALEQAMQAWQQAGQGGNLARAASQLLDEQPDNVRALAISAFLTRAEATTHNDPAIADKAAAFAERGLKAFGTWTRPAEISEPDMAALRRQILAIDYGAIGFKALMHKDYAGARNPYEQALKADPGDLQNAYQLSIAELEATPVDPAGFWWAAHAISLAGNNAEARKSIETYAAARYSRFHGSADGWDAVLAQAATGSVPPAGFAVARAPSAAELAVNAVKTRNLAELSIHDWEFILAQAEASPANKAAADKVWAHIQSMEQQGKLPVQFRVKVEWNAPSGFDSTIVSDTPAETPDVRVSLRNGLAAPAKGTVVTVKGVLTTYHVTPFKFILSDAVFVRE